MARSSAMKMEKIWKSKGVTVNLKLNLLRSSIFAIATCGCESGAMTRNDEYWGYQKELIYEFWKRSEQKEYRKPKDELLRHMAKREGLGSILSGKTKARGEEDPQHHDLMIQSLTVCSVAFAMSITEERKRWFLDDHSSTYIVPYEVCWYRLNIWLVLPSSLQSWVIIVFSRICKNAYTMCVQRNGSISWGSKLKGLGRYWLQLVK